MRKTDINAIQIRKHQLGKTLILSSLGSLFKTSSATKESGTTRTVPFLVSGNSAVRFSRFTFDHMHIPVNLVTSFNNMDIARSTTWTSPVQQRGQSTSE